MLFSGSVELTAQTRPAAPATDAPTRPCLVVRVVDGDTLVCDDDERIRLIGIDAPERTQTPHGALATDALARWAPEGATVLLELDVAERDRYGRLLAYVWRERTLVNLALVESGVAFVTTVPPNVRYVELLTAAQTRARSGGRGFWGAAEPPCRPADHRQGRC